MKFRSGILVFGLFGLLLALIACGNKPRIDDEVAILETSYGRIVFEFAANAAPKHVDNFKTLSRQGFYDGTKFFRVIKVRNRVVGIQGGDPNTINGSPSSWGQGQPGQKTVPAEFSRIKHERGIVAAYHKPNDPNSATSQFFICVTAEPSFDGQFSIFGRVIEGLNVVDSIARAPIDAQGERPVDPVVVSRVSIVKRDEVKSTMNKHDIQFLYEYNRWANAKILAAASMLTPQQFTKDLGSSHRSARDTLAHTLAAEWIWLERWKGTSPKALLDPAEFPSVESLEARWKEVERGCAALIDGLTDASLEAEIAYTNTKGERWVYPLGQMMQHVVNHSSYHRGQVTTMLRQLGAEVTPVDFLVFVDQK